MSAPEPEDLPRVRRLLTGDEPARTIGKYRIVREVGRGGMGIVYEAIDPDLGRRVALKTLDGSAATPKYVDLLRREAALAAKLKHPNIVPVHEVGTVGLENAAPVHFIAMDFVAGVTLAEQIPRMSRRKRIEVLEILAGTVAFAHEQGVVHRDLKPQNVLLEPTTQHADALGWRVYLTDFGLAKQMSGEDLTRSGTVMGTPHYMAPEQVRGQMSRMGPWTDVWSLGVMLYEMIARKSPFEGRNALEVYEGIVAREPRPPRSVERAIPPDLETICLKALEKDPTRRYSTAAGLAEDLRRYLREEPIAARPVGRAARIWKGVRRRPAVWALGSLAFLALAVAGGIWIGAVRRERRLEATRRREIANAEDLRRRREEALQRLSALWGTITERKRELRQLRVPVDRGRRALLEAVAAVDAHVEDWPDDPQGYYVRAQGRMWLGDLSRAEEDVRAALERVPNFGLGWMLLGTIKVQRYEHGLSGRTVDLARRLQNAAPLLDEAVEAFRRAGTDLGGPLRTREVQVMERVAWALQRFQKDRKPEEPARLLEEALQEYKAEEYAFWLAFMAPSNAEAIRWHTKAIEWAPGFAAAYLHRAMMKEADGDFKGAMADLTATIGLADDDPAPYYERARMRQKESDGAGALADYDRALDLDKDHFAARVNRGSLKIAMQDFEGARPDLEWAIRLDENCAEAWYNLGIVEHVRGNFRDAFADYDRAIRLRPDYLDAYCSRAMVKEKTGDKAGAIADFETALSMAPPGWRWREDTERRLDVLRGRP